MKGRDTRAFWSASRARETAICRQMGTWEHPPQALASLYRELSYNDIHVDLGRQGSGPDQNSELVLPHPLR
jgi:hypothetical protein